MVSGYPTSTNFPQVDELSTDQWDLGCHIMFIIASCVIGLGLEVEAFGKALVWENSSLGSRVRVG